jgi:hypothetical protein
MEIRPSNGLRRSARDVFFEQIVPGRECGACVKCCEVLRVEHPELRKPAGILCSHNTGTGCGIYETRPSVCRSWYCLWRRISAMPERARPDQLGIIFTVEGNDASANPFEHLYVAARAVTSPADLETPDALTAFAMFIREGSLPLWVGFGRELRLRYPDERLVDAILHPSETVWQHLVPKALAWRKRWAMDPSDRSTSPLHAVR